MSILLPFIYICSLSLLFVALTKRNFGDILPFALMSAVLIVYIFGIFGKLKLGYYVTVLLAFSGIVYAVYEAFIKKRFQELIKNYFTLAFFIFVIIYAVIIIINRNRVVHLWDEVSHWASMAKEMMRLDMFYSVEESLLASHKDYPPAMTIFQYIFANLSGGYEEGFLYRAHQILSLSLFMPAIAKIKFEKKVRPFIKAALIPVIILIGNTIITNDYLYYSALYVDNFLGLVFAYCVMCLFFEDKYTTFGMLRLSAGLSMLLLVKQFAAVLYLLALFIIIIDYIYNKRNEIKEFNLSSTPKDKAKKISFSAVTLFIFPLCFRYSWNLYMNRVVGGGQFSTSSIKLFESLAIVLGLKDGGFRTQVVKNFINETVFGKFITEPVNLSLLLVMIATALLFVFLAFYAKGIYKKGRITLLNVLIFLSSLGFSYAMLLTWMYSFGEVAGLMLISYLRYMTTFWFGAFAIIIMLFLIINEKKYESKPNSSMAILCGVTAVICIVSALSGNINIAKKPEYNYNSIVNFADDAELIRNYTDEDDNVFIITQRNDDYEMFVFRYLLMPQVSNMENFNLSAFQYNSSDDVHDAVPPEEFCEIIIDGNYSFVYIFDTDDYLTGNYAQLFGGAAPEPGSLYRVENNSGNELGFIKVN